MSQKVPVSIPLRKRFGLVPGSDRTEADRAFRENWWRAFGGQPEVIAQTPPDKAAWGGWSPSQGEDA